MDEIEACLTSFAITDDREAFETKDLIEMDRLYATNDAFDRVSEPWTGFDGVIHTLSPPPLSKRKNIESPSAPLRPREATKVDEVMAVFAWKKPKDLKNRQHSAQLEYANEVMRVTRMEAKFKKERADAQLRLDALQREITPLPDEKQQQATSIEDERAILTLMTNDFKEEELRLAKLRGSSTTKRETSSSSPVIDWYRVGKEEGAKLAKLRGPTATSSRAKKATRVSPISPLVAEKLMGPSSDWHHIEKEVVRPMSPLDVEKIMGPTLDRHAVGDERPLLIEMMEMIVSLGERMELLTVTINNNATAVDMDLYIHYASQLNLLDQHKIVDHFEVTRRRRIQCYQSRNHVKRTFSIRITLYK